MQEVTKITDRAARAITCASYDIRTTSLLEELKWNKLVINRKKQKAILMHKTIKKMTPQYLQEMFTFKENDYSLSKIFDVKCLFWRIETGSRQPFYYIKTSRRSGRSSKTSEKCTEKTQTGY